MDTRHSVHPRDVKRYTTEELRNDFLIQNLFSPDQVNMVYSHVDRMITGGVCPLKPVALKVAAGMGVDYFLERREIGIINIGGAGLVVADGKEYSLDTTDGLYIGMGTKEIAFSSVDVNQPAKFYFNWDGFDHIHLTGIPPALSAGCRELVYELMTQARAKGVQISYDPNLRFGLWPDKEEMVRVINELACRADIVFPGIDEGKLLTGKESVEDIAAFYHDAGVKTVVIKLGAEGAYTSSEGRCFCTQGFPVERVVDTVGAGDGFAVGVVSGILEGLPLEEAVKRGTAIGALAVMSPGDNDGLPDRESLTAFMQKED